MKNFYDVLNRYVSEKQPSFGDGESVLTLLYEAYSECNRLDDTQIKADFNELYRLMNGMELTLFFWNINFVAIVILFEYFSHNVVPFLNTFLIQTI